MKKGEKKNSGKDLLATSELRLEATLENYKRSQSLPHSSPVDLRSRLFFERILSVKKVRDLMFCGKVR